MTKDSSGRAKGRLVLLVILLIAWLSAVTRATAGHESPFYPSFYPQEIQIETVDPASAGPLLEKNVLHVYIGTDPFAGSAIPANVSAAEYLGSYLVVTFNTAFGQAQNRETRCATGTQIRDALARLKEAIVFHPYPVTPYHDDYLHHYDLIESLLKKSGDVSGRGQLLASGMPLKVRAQGRLAEALAQSGWLLEETGWDAAVEEVDVAGLMASRTVSLNGWLGPPWLKEGWFHAYLLLANTISAGVRKAAVEEIYQGLVRGTSTGVRDRLDRERKLVTLLTQGCERMVLGYRLKRAYTNADFAQGVENIAHDSHAGFLSPIFFRTVKLKEFPWNGWLKLGTEAKAATAWNPIAGFTDPFGRLVWFAAGDPALFPSPYNGSWIPNRVTFSASASGSNSGPVDVPPDAFLPERGTGLLRQVGNGKTAKAKVLYRVPLSTFHDGTRMSVADLLYPYIFAYRWGARSTGADSPYDPFIDASSAILREQFAGLKVLRTEQEVKKFGPDLEFVWQVPTIEVYLNFPPPAARDVAALAPPWSSLPWHLLVLMEEAITRGLAAFSLEEAQRRKVAWLDLVRDQDLLPRLASLTEEFERRSYVPDALAAFVRPDGARQRWTALRQHYQTRGHFLVTNGPYRLEKWSEASAVLQVFRDVNYPLGVGSFDRFVLPPKAYISRVVQRRHGLQVTAEVEKAVRAQRAYTMVREPLMKDSTVGSYPIQAVCNYVVVSPSGAVVHSGVAPYVADGSFGIDLKGLKSGRYRVMLAVYTNDNYVNPDIRTLEYRVGR